MKKLFPILFISLFIFSCDSNDNLVELTCESLGLIEQDGLCVDDCGVVNGDNSTCSDGDSEDQMGVDVDWILVKTSNYSEDYSEPNLCDEDDYIVGDNPGDIIGGLNCSPYQTSNIGYFLYFTSSSNLTHNIVHYIYDAFGEPLGEIFTLDVNNLDTLYNLSISYNNEIFNYDLSDSFIGGESSNSQFIDCFPPNCGFYNLSLSIEPLERIIYNQELGYFTLFSLNDTYGTELNTLTPNELIDYR